MRFLRALTWLIVDGRMSVEEARLAFLARHHAKRERSFNFVKDIKAWWPV